MKTKNCLQIITCIVVASLFVNIVRGASRQYQDPTTPIVITPFPGIAEGTPRNQSSARIEASFDMGLSVIDVWLRNAGTSVIVDIGNVTTGASYQYFVSGDGSDSLPISGASGYWTITFTLADGSIFYGTFIL